MSLIHEALEKVEQEKKEEREDLFKRAPPAPREDKRTIYGIEGALLFFLLLGLVYYLAFPRPSETPKNREGEGRRQVLPPLSEARVLPFSSSRGEGERNQFSLTGITREGTEWIAIINNQLVRVGDGVGGATVEAIQPGRVVIQFKGRTITLNLFGETP